MTDRGLLHAGEHVTYTAHPDWGTGTIALELRHVTRPKPRA